MRSIPRLDADVARVPSGATPYRTNQVRAFGHFGTLPSVSQRVVNETAAVVAYVNREIVGR